ncbi:ECF transporter S component [[Mycoplasma] mobile]|uniref:ECF transporter S component n=1 Tax=Mycoplasma mobile (strain ATCC 43663 / 163K / NCTC 11711) TaxID=267748 RepID=Q6KIK9_MYCM1|nr:ECF transporter S component [[Mycoplasma] mobile]AAT27567.1 conserved hypothetical protein [Mycoplasma mobile 163K]
MNKIKLLTNEQLHSNVEKWKWNKANVSNFLKTNFYLSIKDIALMGILMGLYLIVAALVNYTLIGVTRINFDYLFFILIGIIFGPFKGAFWAIFADTFSLLLTGRIAFWLIHYAITPPLIAIISYFFFLLYRNKNDKLFVIPFSLSIVSLASVFAVFSLGWIRNNLKIDGLNGQVTFFAILAISLISVTVIFINIFCFLKYIRTGKNIYKRIIYILALIIFIKIFARWLWGPIAFIEYYNVFLAKGRVPFTLQRNFPIISLRIILKSALVIPLFTLLIIPLVDVTKLLQKKYFYKYDYSNSYI